MQAATSGSTASSRSADAQARGAAQLGHVVRHVVHEFGGHGRGQFGAEQRGRDPTEETTARATTVAGPETQQDVGHVVQQRAVHAGAEVEQQQQQ